jgi:hypothetical protein
MHDADKSLSVKFFLHPRLNPRKTKDAGREIYDEIEMVSIQTPGNNKTVHNAPAGDFHWDGNNSRSVTYKARFAEAYGAFKRGTAEMQSGSPLTVLGLNTAQIAELHAKSVRTVEHLAGMSDTNISRMGHGTRDLVNKARAFVDSTTGAAATLKEIEALKAQIAELKGEAKPVDDKFAGYSDDDLKNMIRDAGGDVPRGAASRATLIARLDDLAEKAA